MIGVMPMNNKCFAAVRKDIIDLFLQDTHYDDKALTLFLLLRFYAGCSLQFYANDVMLCEMMNLSNRPENRNSIMSNILQMEKDDLLIIVRDPKKKFFRLDLDYDMFMPQDNYVIIYKEEFDTLFKEKSRDKLLLLLYCIKKFQYKKTGISFPSVETIMESSGISKPTVCRGIEKLYDVLDIYKARIIFYDGEIKDVNYYRSLTDGRMSEDQIERIVRKYYKNVKKIKRKE